MRSRPLRGRRHNSPPSAGRQAASPNRSTMTSRHSLRLRNGRVLEPNQYTNLRRRPIAAPAHPSNPPSQKKSGPGVALTTPASHGPYSDFGCSTASSPGPASTTHPGSRRVGPNPSAARATSLAYCRAQSHELRSAANRLRDRAGRIARPAAKLRSHILRCHPVRFVLRPSPIRFNTKATPNVRTRINNSVSMPMTPRLVVSRRHGNRKSVRHCDRAKKFPKRCKNPTALTRAQIEQSEAIIETMFLRAFAARRRSAVPL